MGAMTIEDDVLLGIVIVIVVLLAALMMVVGWIGVSISIQNHRTRRQQERDQHQIPEADPATIEIDTNVTEV